MDFVPDSTIPQISEKHFSDCHKNHILRTCIVYFNKLDKQSKKAKTDDNLEETLIFLHEKFQYKKECKPHNTRLNVSLSLGFWVFELAHHLK